jgi:hypothetical protein
MSGLSDKTGGPAFADTAPSASDDVYHQLGMDLRDYFAAHAMAGLIAHVPAERVAALSYKAADAMIAARATGEA